ncbi:MAG: hypothetical protein M3O15_07665, partial [Acidobacteriota bacterium]|nr:hypothetical protein [Acidobacteriota bacterium]
MRLRWRTDAEADWHSGDGHVAVRTGARSVRVSFRNEGVVAAGLVLRAEDVARLPDWIDREGLGERILALLPDSGETELEIPLVPVRLAPLFELREEAVNNAPREAQLPFLTNLNELRTGRWSSRPFKLTLLATRKPWASPACSLYRFLPTELLAGEGIEHRIELHNETLEALDLSQVRISDDPDPGPPGHVRLPAEAILLHAPFNRQRIEAGASWSAALRLSTPGSPTSALGWFAARVEYLGESAETREPHRLCCLIRGRVGRGPALQVRGAQSLLISPDQLQRECSFTLENPGQISVAIAAIEILRLRDGSEEPAGDRDWLSISGLSPDELLEPGEVRALSVHLHPNRRQRDELAEDECQRRLRITHDGLARQGQRSLELDVFARFGRAEELVAGVDFGTTNSVVCIGGLDRAYALRLESASSRQQDRIRSLMYFDSSARGSTDDRFLFGEAAWSSAAIRPENLVRSIKTVVVRDPRTRYVFYKRIPGMGDQRVT